MKHDRRLRALDDFIAGYEAEHGEITEDEMAAAMRRARERGISSETVHVAAAKSPMLGRSDATDAAVVCLARDGDDILTSDPDDLQTWREPLTFT